MREPQRNHDLVARVVADGVLTEAERGELIAAFATLDLRGKLALLRDIEAEIAAMPDAGDHGVWSALLAAQETLRAAMPGAGGAAPPPDAVQAKQLLTRCAMDGQLDDKERLELKRMLNALGPQHSERLLHFVRRREMSAHTALRKTGFAQVRHFLEDHLEASHWSPVTVGHGDQR